MCTWCSTSSTVSSKSCPCFDVHFAHIPGFQKRYLVPRLMCFVACRMEQFVAHRLFLNQAVSWRDVTPFRAAGCVGKGRQVASPTSSSLFHLLSFSVRSLKGSGDNVMSGPDSGRTRCRSGCVLATSCLQQTWGCVHRLQENYCMQKHCTSSSVSVAVIFSHLSAQPPEDTSSLNIPLSQWIVSLLRQF